jgi:alpha-ketoglutarate-dependent taurine dioxygenase
MITDNYFYTFSSQTQQEIYALIKSLPYAEKIEDIALPESNQLVAFKEEIEFLRNELETGSRMIIIKPLDDLFNLYSIQEQRTVAWLMANILGEPLTQNEAGDKIICVYDRDRNNSMVKGARYHQTREGGTIHTDNVNVSFHWDYMLLNCISPAREGGETILVNGITIHRMVKEKYPDVLSILETNFVWEKRGIDATTYEAPIITYTLTGQPRFRHLRPYMESAHKKNDRPLTSEQQYALDTLDALIKHSDNQFRHTFLAGEILLTYDSQVFHGRTCFSDAPEAVTIQEWSKDLDKPMKRTLDRMWIKKN